MNKKSLTYKVTYLILLFSAVITTSYAQPEISAKVDAKQIVIGDQVRLFIEAKPDANERLIWANIPDTFNNLEVVEKGKIDTVSQNNITTYKQRLLVTGWDSGMFQIPSFTFTSVPKAGDPYKIGTDSFEILVQTIPVDTTQPFKPIAEIMTVETSWLDYIWYIVGAIVAIALIVFLLYYFRKNKGLKAPTVQPKKPQETPYQRAIRLLNELEQQELWQQDHVKQYYTELTDIIRVYIEERFRTPAMELTSDELLVVVRRHKDMQRYNEHLSMILQTADMAKFAKAKPLPQEHTDAMEYAKQFVKGTKPADIQNTDKNS